MTATGRILAEARDPQPRVLILTTFDLDKYVYAALRAGAAGFLLKAMHRDRLYSAIRAVAAGNSIIDPEMTRRLIEEHTPERTMSSQQPPKCLSAATRSGDIRPVGGYARALSHVSSHPM